MDAFYSKSVQLSSSISSDENLKEDCNGFILKENFTKAVNLGNHGALVDFAWGSEMFAEEIPLKELKLKEQEGIFPIPVTLSNIGNLTEVSQCRSSKHSWEIDASKVCGSTLVNLDLSSLVTQHLQLPMEMNIEAKFSRLILYNGGNGFTHSLSSSFVEGKFGAAVLQVPVEGGHEGGNLNVDYEGRKKLFESHERSDTGFYLTAFYDSCDNFIKPISRGFKLVLVYDLLWTNATNEIPSNFPVFLQALKQIKESLRPWSNRFKLLKSKMENEKPQNLVEEMKEPTVIASKLQQDSIEPIKCIQTQGNVLFVEKTLQENVFFFVLQESYEQNILSFLLLQGQDRVFANILLNCDFLDVNLANATQSSFEVQKGKVDVIEISQVIDSDEITRNLSIKLEWDKNCVGLVPSYPKKKLQDDNSKDRIEDGKKNLHHGVLLIWPKHQSVQMYCRYRQDSVEPNVDAFESSSIHSKGFLLERLQEFLNPSVEHATPVGSILSFSDYEYQLRDFESAYEEVSRTAVVSANQIPECGMVTNPLPTKWVMKYSEVEDIHAHDNSSASGVELSSSGTLLPLTPSSDFDSKHQFAIDIHSSNKSLGCSSYFWEGVIFSKDNDKLKVKAFEVIGSEVMPNFVLAMPPTLECVGRITSEKFLNNLKLKGMNDQGVVVVTFLPVETESDVYCSLINNMKQGRIVVTKSFCEVVEDFYIVLLLKDDAVLRDVNLFSADNSYFQNQKDDLLLGVAVFSK